MQFEMSFSTLKMMLKAEAGLQENLGFKLDFSSDNLISDFFELCSLCKDRRVALQADQIWAGLMKDNSDADKRRALNQYRARMQDAIACHEEVAA